MSIMESFKLAKSSQRPASSPEQALREKIISALELQRERVEAELEGNVYNPSSPILMQSRARRSSWQSRSDEVVRWIVELKSEAIFIVLVIVAIETAAII